MCVGTFMNVYSLSHSSKFTSIVNNSLSIIAVKLIRPTRLAIIIVTLNLFIIYFNLLAPAGLEPATLRPNLFYARYLRFVMP